MMAGNSRLFSRRAWSEEGFDLGMSVGGGEEEAHVLAVDDSVVDRKVIERLFKIYSCKVTAVDSVKRALQFLGLDDEATEEEDKSSCSSVVDAGLNLKVDLIITDYSMPELTGYQLLKKIKESSTFREIPVVIMSSENVLVRINRCLEEGAEDFIVKPVKLSDMERLKQHLQPKHVSSTKYSNKRKKPEDGPPTLTASPTSSQSPSESPPSSQSPPSSPLPPLSPPLDSPPPTSQPFDSPATNLKSTSSSDVIILCDSLL